jgi:hypothetical protein
MASYMPSLMLAYMISLVKVIFFLGRTGSSFCASIPKDLDCSDNDRNADNQSEPDEACPKFESFSHRPILTVSFGLFLVGGKTQTTLGSGSYSLPIILATGMSIRLLLRATTVDTQVSRGNSFP